MTTVAADRAQIAADSKTTSGETWFHATKLYRIGNAVVGVSGDSTAIEKFLTWYRGGRKRKRQPEFKDSESFSALILTRAGLYHVDESMGVDLIKDDYFAIGSGAACALVAMDLGLSPRDAVLAASRRDQHTGGEIEVMGVP